LRPESRGRLSSSRTGFEHEVERRLGGPAHAGEAARHERRAQARLSGLSAERELAALESALGVQSIVEKT
jgi:hypothetical protein